MCVWWPVGCVCVCVSAQVRGRAEWLVPEGSDDSCRVLFLHGGSYQWYSGVDKYYQPHSSRIAASCGMPVLAIDYRLAPEWAAPSGDTDAEGDHGIDHNEKN